MPITHSSLALLKSYRCGTKLFTENENYAVLLETRIFTACKNVRKPVLLYRLHLLSRTEVQNNTHCSMKTKNVLGHIKGFLMKRQTARQC
jgi:hypothetical protein